MSDVKLPSGHKVTLKDPKDITHGDRKALLNIEDNLSSGVQGFALMDNMLVLAVLDWDFDLLIPSVKRESLDKLTPTDYDALSEATKPLTKAIYPSLNKSEETEADPKASTVS